MDGIARKTETGMTSTSCGITRSFRMTWCKRLRHRDQFLGARYELFSMVSVERNRGLQEDGQFPRRFSVGSLP